MDFGLCGGLDVGPCHISDPHHDVPWFGTPVEVCQE